MTKEEREKLRRLQYTKMELVIPYRYKTKGREYRIGWNEAIDAVIAALERLDSQWIPCKDRLPQQSDFYLVSGGEKVWICQYIFLKDTYGGWVNDANNPVVTAWIPLPRAYEGGRCE